MNVFESLDIEDILRYALALVVIFATLAMILYSIWGGFLMILSGGKEDKVKGAINHIRHALIGLVFLLIVLYTFPIIAKIGGLAYPVTATPTSIFETIREISGKIFNVGLDSNSVPSVAPLDAGTSDFSNL